MKTKWMKLVVFYIVALSLSIATPIFAANAFQLNTTLTDNVDGDKTGPAKAIFTPDTPMIYLIWDSNQLKEGQTLKSAWIAENTNGVAPPNYIIDEAGLTLKKDSKDKLLSVLSGGYWNGKFTLSKPTKGWPAGKYRIDVYLDNQLVKSVKFVIAANAAASKSEKAWGAISVDTAKNNQDPYYGTGGGNTKEEAEQNSQKFCAEAGGKQCKVMIDYQQCGAYALGKQSSGKGEGATSKIAVDNAMKECNSKDCTMIVSDCN